MTIKFELVVKRCGGKLDISRSYESTDPLDEEELIYLAGLMDVVDTYESGLGKSTPDCACPACKANRKKKHECSDLH